MITALIQILPLRHFICFLLIAYSLGAIPRVSFPFMELFRHHMFSALYRRHICLPTLIPLYIRDKDTMIFTPPTLRHVPLV